MLLCFQAEMPSLICQFWLDLTCLSGVAAFGEWLVVNTHRQATVGKVVALRGNCESVVDANYGRCFTGCSSHVASNFINAKGIEHGNTREPRGCRSLTRVSLVRDNTVQFST